MTRTSIEGLQRRRKVDDGKLIVFGINVAWSKAVYGKALCAEENSLTYKDQEKDIQGLGGKTWRLRLLRQLTQRWDIIEMVFKKTIGGGGGNWIIQLKMGTSDGLLWMRQWTLDSRTIRAYFLSSWQNIRSLRTHVLHADSQIRKVY
jgi:hypothetical protein